MPKRGPFLGSLNKTWEFKGLEGDPETLLFAFLQLLNITKLEVPRACQKPLKWYISRLAK